MSIVWPSIRNAGDRRANAGLSAVQLSRTGKAILVVCDRFERERELANRFSFAPPLHVRDGRLLVSSSCSGSSGVIAIPGITPELPELPEHLVDPDEPVSARRERLT